MKDRVILIIVAATLMIGGSAACSSEGLSAKQDAATLAPGTAKLTIDGKDLPTTRVVHCAPPEQYMTTITTGDDASGATVMVSNAGRLTVELVRIRNLDGFTGGYNRGLSGGDATVALTDSTYNFAGAVSGYGTKSPEATTAAFTIKVSC